jgi:hypothetical protein
VRRHVVFFLSGIEVTLNGTNTIKSAPLSFGDTVCKQALLRSIDPILEGISGEGKVGFYVIKEVIMIGREKEFAFIINSLYFSFCFKLLYLLMASLIMAMAG